MISSTTSSSTSILLNDGFDVVSDVYFFTYVSVNSGNVFLYNLNELKQCCVTGQTENTVCAHPLYFSF